MLYLCGCFNELSVSDVCFPSLFTPPPFFSPPTGDYILDAKPKEISEAQRLNYEQVRSTTVVLFSQTSGLAVEVFALRLET